MSEPATRDGGPSLTVHQWLVRLAPEYLRRYGATMPARQREVLHTILSCRTLFKEGLQRQAPDLFNEVPAQVWKGDWNVGCQAAGSGENALRYLARYVFKTATGNRLVSELPDGRLLWPYRASRTGQAATVALPPTEWLRRFLQHILPPHFARVRTFGFFHPAAKVRLNRVRALLGQKPWLTPAEQDTWQPPAEPQEHSAPPAPTAAPAASDTRSGTSSASTRPARCGPACPRCQKAMVRLGAWRTPEQLSGLLAAWRVRPRPAAHPP